MPSSRSSSTRSATLPFSLSFGTGRETAGAIDLWRRGKLQKVAAAGDRAPGGGIFASFGNPALNSKGNVAFGAVIEQGSMLGGIFLASGHDIHPVIAAGSPSPTGGIFARFSERIALGDSAAIAFSAVLRQAVPTPPSSRPTARPRSRWRPSATRRRAAAPSPRSRLGRP